MAEELDTVAEAAYEAYRRGSQMTILGGVPMPVWEHLSVPEQDAWREVARAMQGLLVPVVEEAPAARGRAREREG